MHFLTSVGLAAVCRRPLSVATQKKRGDVHTLRTGLALIGLGVAASGCTATGQTRADRQAQGVDVEVAALERVRIERRVSVSGTLVSPDQARVSSEVAGIVVAVRVELGTDVRAGSELVRLEPRELTLALARAESALRQVEAQLGIDRAPDRRPPPDDQVALVRQARANRDDARGAFERAQALNDRGLLSPVDRNTAETRLMVADANYEAALDHVGSLKASLQDRRAAHDLARKALDDAVVRSPVAGAVSERAVQPGEYIRENTPVATIVQMDPLRLKTAIQEKHAGIIRPGQVVDFVVEAFPTDVFHGTVAFVSPVVDQATRAFPVEVLVANRDRRLKPGFFAKGEVLTHVDDGVLAAPAAAISTLAGVSTVFVIDEGQATQRQVTLGASVGSAIEIVAGLTGDERLATSNLGQLATGTRVRLAGAGEVARGSNGNGRQSGQKGSEAE
jgi:RND family efflux transporter MFP subunit